MSKEENTQQAVENIQGKVLEWMNGLEEVAKNNGDAVKNFTEASVELGFQSIVFAGIQELIQGFLALAAFIIFAVIARKCFRQALSYHNDDETSFVYGTGCVFTGLGALINAGITLAHLASIWTWVMIFDPKLYVAYRVTRQFLDLGTGQ